MRISFADPWPVFAGLLLAAAVVLGLVFAYRIARTAFGGRDRLLFLAGRILAALLLLSLLFEPVLSRERLRTEKLGVAVLVDRSRSMSIPDSYGGKPRYTVAKEFLHRKGTGLEDLLGDDFSIHAYEFAEGVGAPDGRATPDGILTDIAGALRTVGEAAAREEMVAVVLLSDGAENAGGDARTAARALGLPVYTVGLGSRADQDSGRRDLALGDLNAPENVFSGNTVVVQATVRSTGYDVTDPGNRRVRVVLSEGEREVASEWAEFTEDGAPVPLPLRFVPEGRGTRTYRVSVPVRGDETIQANNSRTFSVKVHDRRSSVLFFDATLRWEAKFLRDFLARDPAIDLTSVLHAGQGRLVVNGDPHGADLSGGLPRTEEGFGKFDVVVIGDVEASVLDPRCLDLLRKRIEGGGGLLTLGGYHAYGAGGYAGTPLAEVLPVFISPTDGQHEEEATLSITPEGRVHPILSGLAAWFEGSDRPTLRGFSRVQGGKPGATVLLEADGEGEREGIILAAHRYGEGRVATFTGDTTWIWYRSEVLGGPDGFYGRFWGQILQYLLEREPEVEETGKALALFVDRPVYRIGETVRVRARVRGPEGEPVKDASVSASISFADESEDLPLRPVDRAPGHFEGHHLALRPGPHRVTATARRPDGTRESCEAVFTVENDSVEMDRVDLDDAKLTAIARASGGRYYHAPPTAAPIDRDIRGSLVSLLETQEIRLTNTPLFFLLITALLAAEWYLRRRRNLL